MYCKKCGCQNDDGAIVCSSCGASMNSEETINAVAQEPVKTSDPGKGLAVASLCLGIASLILGCLGCMGPIPAIVGIVLGIMAKKRGSSGSMAVIGIILNVVAVVVSVIMMIVGIGLGVFGGLMESAMYSNYYY